MKLSCPSHRIPTTQEAFSFSLLSSLSKCSFIILLIQVKLFIDKIACIACIAVNHNVRPVNGQIKWKISNNCGSIQWALKQNSWFIINTQWNFIPFFCAKNPSIRKKKPFKKHFTISILLFQLPSFCVISKKEI